jgi:hypothetical protein
MNLIHNDFRALIASPGHPGERRRGRGFVREGPTRTLLRVPPPARPALRRGYATKQPLARPGYPRS